MGGMGMPGMDNPAPNSGGGPVGGCDNPVPNGKQVVSQIMEEMPNFVMQDPRGFVLRSAVPASMASALQWKAAGVMQMTGTKITFHGEAGVSARMMSIEGPLFNICGSYMLMMRRYLEAER